jgi:glyoxylase-like metal-dependent hydrolase (beta-lactamase superfamily II)
MSWKCLKNAHSRKALEKISGRTRTFDAGSGETHRNSKLWRAHYVVPSPMLLKFKNWRSARPIACDGRSPSRLARVHQCPSTQWPHALYGRQIRTHHGRIIKIAELMERLAVCPAVISLLFLISCASAFAGGQHGFSINVFTSPDDQFWVNSVIIEGVHEVMLVDAQLTKTGAEKVLQEIKETKKPLSIIYITHEHADHFLGLQVFKEAYPRARIIATSAVVDRINKVYQEKIDKWKKMLGPGATSHVVAIEKFDGNFIEFESSKIEVFKNIQGDTDENTMLWIPGQRTLVAGDVVVNNMHVYTAETDSEARGKWLKSLNKIRELKPSVVIPGHSKVGAPLDANTAVDFTENYLLAFEEELKKAKDPDSFINTMKERFPSADFLLAIERGAKANVKPSQTN